MALAIPALFGSLAEHAPPDAGVIVAGYVVMHLTMVSLGLRAARRDPDRAETVHVYVSTIVVAQVGWSVLPFLDLSLSGFQAAAVPLFLVEVAVGGGPRPVPLAPRGIRATSPSATACW